MLTRATVIFAAWAGLAACGSSGAEEATPATAPAPGKGEPSPSAANDGGVAPSDTGTASASSSACGASRCRVDQTCVANHCTTPCTGIRVPGDYATVRDAALALNNVGGTVCVAAGTYPDPIQIHTTKDITVIATSDDVVTTAPVNLFAWFEARVELRGFTVRAPVYVGDFWQGGGTPTPRSIAGVITIAGSTIASLNNAIRIDARLKPTGRVVVDGCDLSSPGGTAVSMHLGISAALSALSIQNSFVHDSSVGVIFSSDVGSYGPDVALVNNTFVSVDEGLTLFTNNLDVGKVTYANNVFMNGKVATNVAVADHVDHAANALFGNVTNFASKATPSADDVFGDPLLDLAATPPSPRPGSPLAAAAKVALAPVTDYWGTPRNKNAPTVGAIEAN